MLRPTARTSAWTSTRSNRQWEVDSLSLQSGLTSPPIGELSRAAAISMGTQVMDMTPL